jgi:hypothetical protein
VSAADLEGAAVLLVDDDAGASLLRSHALEQQMQAAKLDNVHSSRAASLALAKNYVGLALPE